jgi:hypothetical protein
MVAPLTPGSRLRTAAIVMVCMLGLALAASAGAVDLRDWGRKFATSERFVVLSQFGSQAVLDKETQLVWERSPESTLRTWFNAEVTRCVSAQIGGRLGWRLPTRVELQSLLSPTVSGSVKLPVGHPFVGIVSNRYWASDEFNLSNTGTLFKPVVDVGTAAPLWADALNFQARAWCVRGTRS